MHRFGMPIVDIGTVIDFYPEVITYPIGYKPKIVSYYLKKNTKSVSLIDPADNYAEYEKLITLMAPLPVELRGGLFVLPPLENPEYERLWRDHSRWLDYPPEHVRTLTEEYVGELMAIAAAMRAAGLEVEVRGPA